jgi:methylated-DNA-[protein]-cysteine S-methyltransferase
MKPYCSIQTPLGEMNALVMADSLCGLWFVGQKHAPQHGGDWQLTPDHPVFAALRRQLADYFAGRLRAFDLPLAPHGTTFQLAVWGLLRTIPAGTTVTYGALARQLAGRGAAAQAVGGAVGRNPLAIVIPCHRVVGADGSLTGYAGGLDRKAALLALEQGEEG